jgi:triosephosphate isomerase (TIM)
MAHQKKLIIGNLKMNLVTRSERERYLALVKKQIDSRKLNQVEVVICPPFVHLEYFRSKMSKSIALGSQDVFFQSQGSFTGEVSPLMLKIFGVKYVIVGHSERRRFFAENDEEINLKLIVSLKNNLFPVLCVGETLEEKNRQMTLEIITSQVKTALNNVSRTKLGNLVIAYEPVWSVGSDNIPSSNEIMGAKLLIRKILVDLYGKKYAEKVRIIYGGSVNRNTVKQVCIDPEMDGALIGRESLIPGEMAKIGEIINKYKNL